MVPQLVFWAVMGSIVVSYCGMALWWLSGSPTAAQQHIAQYAVPAVFLFLYSAAPSAVDQLYTFQFYLFFDSAPCKVAFLSLVSSLANFLSFAIYGLVCNRRRIRRVIVATSITSLSLGLLWIPLVGLDFSNDDDGACVQLPLTTSCISVFTYTVAVRFLTSVSGMLAFTPSTVLATESTPVEHKTMSYAIFLSIIDSADSCSGWLTSFIIHRLGMSYGEWSALPNLIWISALSQLAVLGVVPWLRDAKYSVKTTEAANGYVSLDLPPPPIPRGER